MTTKAAGATTTPHAAAATARGAPGARLTDGPRRLRGRGPAARAARGRRRGPTSAPAPRAPPPGALGVLGGRTAARPRWHGLPRRRSRRPVPHRLQAHLLRQPQRLRREAQDLAIVVHR